MRRPTPTRPVRAAALLLALLALVAGLAGCGDGDGDDVDIEPGPPRSDQPAPDQPDPAGALDDAVVVHIGEGEPPLDGPPAVAVVDPEAPDAVDLFVASERDAAAAALADADLDGRTLLGGLVHEGCFPAAGVAVDVVDDAVVFVPQGLDPKEGRVDCVRAVVTSALVSVPTDQLPTDDPAAEPDDPTDDPTDRPADEVAGEVVLLEPVGYESSATVGPGLVRDRVDLEALLGRYGLGEPDRALLGRVETGEEVLVAAVVGDRCSPPVDASLRRTGDALEVVPGYGPDSSGPPDEELVCEALAPALVVLAVDADDVAGATTVDTRPVDDPTGVGTVALLMPIDPGTDPMAAALEDVDLADLPRLDDVDLPPVEDDAVRLVFVVEACQPDTAELVADRGAGTVRAAAQQAGAGVDCDALAPHLVVADLFATHADLEPTVG